MPMTTELHDKDNVIYIDVSDPLTLQDFKDSFGTQCEIMDRTDTKVHLFVTAHKLRQMPNGVLRVRERAPIFSHPNAGLMVIVGAAAVIHVIADMISRLANYKMIRFVETEDQAWELINQQG